MNKTMRVGIPIIGGAAWMGGVCYIELLVKALSSLPEPERPELYLILNEVSLPHLEVHASILPLFANIIFVGDFQKDHPEFYYTPSHRELLGFLDFYFPLMNCAWPTTKVASWIPDFQHLHLPHFFDAEELKGRAETFGNIAAQAKLLVFSSRDAQNDFNRFYPESAAVTRVLSFYALPQDSWYGTDHLEVQRRYGLPDSFLICCNQFWAHKNHSLLFEAIARLHYKGTDVHLVCTGYTQDYRFPGHFEHLMALLQKLGIEHLVHILGNIPRHDQIQLVRRSLALVQPSLFEGWSTVVEDCRALGKTMILSDLPVHQEQAPRHGLFFGRNSSAALARAISEALPQLSPGPDQTRERQAAEEAHTLVRSFARCFCSIVQDSVALAELPEASGPAVPRQTSRAETEQGPGAGSGPPIIVSSPPRITLVTPSYNYGQYLEACIDSVLSQGYPNLEFIILDGGSTDDSVRIIKKYEKHLAHWRSCPDAGQYSAIEEGFQIGSGSLMTWLNADDMFHPGAFDTVSTIFSEDPAIEWLMGRPNSFDEQGRQKVELSFLPLNSRRKYLADQELIQQEGVFWRRGLWERSGGYLDKDLLLAADLELWARFFRTAQLHSVDTLIAGFRDHPLQKSKDKATYTAEANRVLARERQIYEADTHRFSPPAPLPILLPKKGAR